jgi:hypothetical protein
MMAVTPKRRFEASSANNHTIIAKDERASRAAERVDAVGSLGR